MHLQPEVRDVDLFLDTVTTTTNSTAGEAESRIVFVRPVQGSGQVSVIAGNNQTKFGTVSIPLKIEVIGTQFIPCTLPC